jgi:putative transposase
MVANELDYRARKDYVHFNPVKHGLVSQVCDRPYSTFHRLVQEGVYPHDWAGGNERNLAYDD